LRLSGVLEYSYGRVCFCGLRSFAPHERVSSFAHRCKMSTFAADGPQHRNLSGSLEQRWGARGLASYHDSYYHGTRVPTMVFAVLVLVSSAEALENPENLYTQFWHRSSSGPFSDVTWLLAISLAKLRYSALRVALVRFAALFVNPKCRITQLGKQSNIGPVHDSVDKKC
jgi:hypothetical protein